ncbi:DinB family protein [Nakamurella sp.]|uniref:DinB family protein n=1 Tax=Nakamurella sp. TaxID=1869182 RepID=UPI003B39FD3C
MPDDGPGDRADPEWVDDQRARIAELIDEYRGRLGGCLDGLTEQEARRRLVPSKTTLLGLVKHLTFVEGVWFDQAVTGQSATEIGIARTVDGSFTLSPADTIESVGAAYRARWLRSREVMAGRRPDDVVDGRGTRPVWALELQVLRELAHHCGHADILREQILAAREA